MELGAFSVSLAVKDIHASKEFYQKLGFVPFMGEVDQKWLILRNGSHIIGLFEGMFPNNILTFNPGWDQSAAPLEQFTDVRDLQAALKSAGTDFLSEADPESAGPASFMLMDPDGNTILFAQHV